MQTGESPHRNFHKYLVNSEGKAVKSYGHRVSTEEMEEDIVKLLDTNDSVKFDDDHLKQKVVPRTS